MDTSMRTRIFLFTLLLSSTLLTGCTVITNGHKKHYSASEVYEGTKALFSSDKSKDNEKKNSTAINENSSTNANSHVTQTLANNSQTSVNRTITRNVSWERLFNTYMNLKPSFEFQDAVDDYMRVYRSNVWNKYSKNEFEIGNKRQDTISLMKRKANAVDKSTLYVINTYFDYGKYDFNNNKFYLNGLEGQYYSYKHNRGYSYYKSLPREFKIYFSNPNMLGDMEMDRETAQTFVESQKRRRVYAKLFFTINNLEPDSTDFIANLSSINVYSDKNKTNLLYKYK